MTNTASSAALSGPAPSPMSNPIQIAGPSRIAATGQSKQVDPGAGGRTTLGKQHRDDRTDRHDQRRLHHGPGEAGQR